MSKRLDLIKASRPNLCELGVKVQNNIDRREAERAILNLEDEIDLAELHLYNLQNSAAFDLQAVVEAKLEIKEAKEDLEMAQDIFKEYFITLSKEKTTMENLHDEEVPS